MPRYIITLKDEEREQLEAILRKGKHASQKIINAQILLNCDEAGDKRGAERYSGREIAQVLRISERKIDRVKQRFVEEGLEVALNGAPSSRNYERKVDGDVEAHLVALSCSEPPLGRNRWTLHLLAQKAVELNYAPSLSHEAVRQALKKTSSSHGKRWAGLYRPNRTPSLWPRWRTCWTSIDGPTTRPGRSCAWMRHPGN